MNLFEVNEILADISFGDWEFRSGELGRGCFIQVAFQGTDNDNDGVPYEIKGRKWYVSPHAVLDEVVKTCWLAVEIALRHEAMEKFKYGGKAIFHPHTDVDVLYLAQDQDHVYRVGGDP